MLALKQLVGRLPSDELMAKLPSFLVVLFDAFDNQNAEVRKVLYKDQNEHCAILIFFLL
jgi:hypothetical protein